MKHSANGVRLSARGGFITYFDRIIVSF
ncbi:protein of unknown function (plasmid) [Caballeronia sp. S22]